MAHLFIRVELRGSPSVRDYNNLHAYMEQKNWHRTIRSTVGESTLPHAMYQGTSESALVTLATALRKNIETEIWTSAIVLVMSADLWAMDPG